MQYIAHVFWNRILGYVVWGSHMFLQTSLRHRGSSDVLHSWTFPAAKTLKFGRSQLRTRMFLQFGLFPCAATNAEERVSFLRSAKVTVTDTLILILIIQSEFCGFHSDVAEDPALFGYDTASLSIPSPSGAASFSSRRKSSWLYEVT